MFRRRSQLVQQFMVAPQRHQTNTPIMERLTIDVIGSGCRSRHNAQGRRCFNHFSGETNAHGRIEECSSAAENIGNGTGIGMNAAYVKGIAGDICDRRNVIGRAQISENHTTLASTTPVPRANFAGISSAYIGWRPYDGRSATLPEK